MRKFITAAVAVLAALQVTSAAGLFTNQDLKDVSYRVKLTTDLPPISGRWYFVDSSGAATNSGRNVNEACKAIDSAFTKVSAGDGIVLLSAVQIGAALTLSKSEITIVGANEARIENKDVAASRDRKSVV